MWFEKNKQFQKEQYRENMNSYINEHHKAKEEIKFQEKQNEVQKLRKLKEMQQNFRIKQRKNLEERRKKLILKLQEERRIFESEIGQKGKMAVGERKEQLKARVAELRRKNEEEKNRFNKQIEQKRFENGADELRGIGRRVDEERVGLEREIQILEKQRAIEEQWEHEMVMTQLVKMQIAKAKQREMREEEQKKLGLNEMKNILGEQVDQVNRQKEEMLKILEKDKEVLNRRWKAENEMQEYKKIKTKLELEERRKRDEEYNREQKIFKKMQDEREKIADRKLIEDIVTVSYTHLTLPTICSV